MIEFGSMTDKFSETGQKVVRRAMEVSKSRDHNFLSMLHVFTALGEVESGLFVEAIQAVGVDPPSVTRLVEQEWPRAPSTWEKRWPFLKRPAICSTAH